VEEGLALHLHRTLRDILGDDRISVSAFLVFFSGTDIARSISLARFYFMYLFNDLNYLHENWSSLQACHLLSRWFLAQPIFSSLKMEAICSSETSVDTQRTTRRYIPEDGTLYNHRCKNLKYYNLN
jgi:hypothetical protein